MNKERVQYRFDVWLFTPNEDKLVCEDEDIIIDNRLSKLLHFFCQNPNIVFSRDELINEVWNGSILTDQVITQAIFELRKILKTPNRHPMGYIITVPKRGYKLEAEIQEERIEKIAVEPLIVEQPPETEVIQPADPVELPQDAPEKPVEQDKSQVTTPAEEQNTTHQEVLSGDKKPPRRLLVLFAVLIPFIGLGAWLLLQKQDIQVTSQPVDANQDSSVHYLSLEPRYILVEMDDSLKNDALKRGIIQKVLNYLTVYQDFRLILDERHVDNSAHVISFKSKVEAEREYLEINYFNRISKFKHLGRDYLISLSSLHGTMARMLDDLLDSFNIDIEKTILKQQVAELPSQEEALQLVLESIGLTFTTLDREMAVKKVTEAYELAPDNQLVMTNRYLYQLVDIFLQQTSDRDERVTELNDLMVEQLLAAEKEPVNYHIYDALAALELTKDQPEEAMRHLSMIPRNEYTAMSMILYGKIEESNGNTASAEEYYYESILESGHPVILEIAKTLFFKSNLNDIEKKIAEF